MEWSGKLWEGKSGNRDGRLLIPLLLAVVRTLTFTPSEMRNHWMVSSKERQDLS